MLTPSLSKHSYTDAPAFFDALFEYCQGMLELRTLPAGPRTFLSILDAAGRVSFCKRNISKNIYFGPASRDGHGGGKVNIVSIPCAWVDIDFRDTPLTVFQKTFAAFPLPPTAAVQSGNGFHLYWKWKEPAEKEQIGTVESINRSIASYLGGDVKSADAAHILRVPGSINHKYPKPVQLVTLNRREFQPSDFDFLPEVSEPQTEKKNGNHDKWITETLHGVTQGNRNDAAIKLAGYFVSLGVDKDIIHEILSLWNTRNTPPLSDAEIKQVALSASRYELNETSHERIKFHIG